MLHISLRALAKGPRRGTISAGTFFSFSLAFTSALFFAGCGEPSPPGEISVEDSGAPPRQDEAAAPAPAPAAAETPVDIPGIRKDGLLTPDGVTIFIETFRRSAAQDALAAVAESSSPRANALFQAMTRDIWGEIDPALAWESFFGTATHSAFPTSDGAAIVAFHNPWSDTVLMTLWGDAFINPFIIDFEFLLVDMIRKDGRPPFELAPVWTQRGDVLPVEAVADGVVEVIDLLRGRFDPTAPLPLLRWRETLPAIEGAELQETARQAVAAALNRSFGNRLEFLDADSNAATRLFVDRFLATLQSTRDLPLEFWGSDTLPETIEAIAASPPSEWNDFRVACHVQSGDYESVFLYRPDIATACVSLLYLEKNGFVTLQRTDVIDYHDYFAFKKELAATGSGANPSTD